MGGGGFFFSKIFFDVFGAVIKKKLFFGGIGRCERIRTAPPPGGAKQKDGEFSCSF